MENAYQLALAATDWNNTLRPVGALPATSDFLRSSLGKPANVQQRRLLRPQQHESRTSSPAPQQPKPAGKHGSVGG